MVHTLCAKYVLCTVFNLVLSRFTPNTIFNCETAVLREVHITTTHEHTKSNGQYLVVPSAPVSFLSMRSGYTAHDLSKMWQAS